MDRVLGPVFAVEWRLATRRWRLYAARTVFVGGLLVALCVTWLASVSGRDVASLTIAQQAAIGQDFYRAIAGTQLALVLLVAPAAMAGAICQDKATGTLTFLLTTDLTDREIILGKFVARLAPVVGLIGCAVPVLAITTLMGGIDPRALTGVVLATLGVAIAGCSVAMLLSVWGRKVYEVLLGTYALMILWLLAYPVWEVWRMTGWLAVACPEWFKRANPVILCFRPRNGIVDLGEFAWFLGGCLGVSAVLTAGSIATLRPAARRQANRVRGVIRGHRGSLSSIGRQLASISPTRLLPRPSLDGNPVLWREWTRTDPAGWSLGVWGLYVLAAVVAAGIAVHDAWQGYRMGSEMGAILISGVTVMIGLMLMCLSAPTSLSEERSQGSLDVLVATPLSAREIVWGKWLGTYRYVLPVALLPTIIVAANAFRSGHAAVVYLMPAYVLTVGACFTSLGLALAIWIRRPGRAVAATLAAFIVMTVGWLVLIASLVNRDPTGPGLASGSPFFGASVIGMLSLGFPGGPVIRERWQLGAWIVFWVLVYGVAAWGLFEAAARTFDACLGRIPDGPESPAIRNALDDHGLGYEPAAVPSSPSGVAWSRLPDL